MLMSRVLQSVRMPWVEEVVVLEALTGFALESPGARDRFVN